jgi:hypothetical protein
MGAPTESLEVEMATLSLDRVTLMPGTVRTLATVIVARFPIERDFIDSHVSLSGVQAAVSTSRLMGSVSFSNATLTRHLLARELLSSHHTVGAMISGGNSEPSKG